MQEFLDFFSERSTINTMMEPNPPKIKVGKQNYQYNLGQTYEATGTGFLKKGTEVTVVDRYKENGYCYYVDLNGKTHRNGELE